MASRGGQKPDIAFGKRNNVVKKKYLNVAPPAWDDLMAEAVVEEAVRTHLPSLPQAAVTQQPQPEPAPGAEEDVPMGMADGLDLESQGGIAELKERWSRVGAIVMELHDVDGRLHRVRHLLESVGGFRVDLEQEEVFKGGDAQGVDVWNVLATRDD